MWGDIIIVTTRLSYFNSCLMVQSSVNGVACNNYMCDISNSFEHYRERNYCCLFQSVLDVRFPLAVQRCKS